MKIETEEQNIEDRAEKLSESDFSDSMQCQTCRQFTNHALFNADLEFVDNCQRCTFQVLPTLIKTGLGISEIFGKPPNCKTSQIFFKTKLETVIDEDRHSGALFEREFGDNVSEHVFEYVLEESPRINTRYQALREIAKSRLDRLFRLRKKWLQRQRQRMLVNNLREINKQERDKLRIVEEGEQILESQELYRGRVLSNQYTQAEDLFERGFRTKHHDLALKRQIGSHLNYCISKKLQNLISETCSIKASILSKYEGVNLEKDQVPNSCFFSTHMNKSTTFPNLKIEDYNSEKSNMDPIELGFQVNSHLKKRFQEQVQRSLMDLGKMCEIDQISDPLAVNLIESQRVLFGLFKKETHPGYSELLFFEFKNDFNQIYIQDEIHPYVDTEPVLEFGFLKSVNLLKFQVENNLLIIGEKFGNSAQQLKIYQIRSLNESSKNKRLEVKRIAWVSVEGILHETIRIVPNEQGKWQILMHSNQGFQALSLVKKQKWTWKEPKLHFQNKQNETSEIQEIEETKTPKIIKQALNRSKYSETVDFYAFDSQFPKSRKQTLKRDLQNNNHKSDIEEQNIFKSKMDFGVECDQTHHLNMKISTLFIRPSSVDTPKDSVKRIKATEKGHFYEGTATLDLTKIHHEEHSEFQQRNDTNFELEDEQIIDSPIPKKEIHDLDIEKFQYDDISANIAVMDQYFKVCLFLGDSTIFGYDYKDQCSIFDIQPSAPKNTFPSELSNNFSNSSKFKFNLETDLNEEIETGIYLESKALIILTTNQRRIHALKFKRNANGNSLNLNSTYDLNTVWQRCPRSKIHFEIETQNWDKFHHGAYIQKQNWDFNRYYLASKEQSKSKSNQNQTKVSRIRKILFEPVEARLLTITETNIYIFGISLSDCLVLNKCLALPQFCHSKILWKSFRLFGKRGNKKMLFISQFMSQNRQKSFLRSIL